MNHPAIGAYTVTRRKTIHFLDQQVTSFLIRNAARAPMYRHRGTSSGGGDGMHAADYEAINSRQGG